jgi:acyl-CoA thioesterase-1
MFALAAILGCGEAPSEESAGDSSRPPSPGSEGSASGADSQERGEAIRIVFLGDSLTAGSGLPEEEAFPALIEYHLLAEGRQVEVVNAGVSGDTSAGGASRLDWLLRQQPDVLFVCLGANDGLRGLSPAMTESNLREIAERATDAGALVVLAGMKLPPNYGPEYVDRFESLFPSLAEELDLGFVPFLLEGVAGDARLNLADGIHPNAEGHERIAELVLPALHAVLEEFDGNE